MAFLDNCKFNPSAGGTTDWVYSSIVTGYQSPSSANAVNGQTYAFFAASADLSQWELTKGVYNSTTGTFARTTVLYNSSGTGTLQSGAGAKINFSTVPTVAIVSILEDMIPAQAAQGLGMANGTLVASVASNILTVAVKTFAGNDPSLSDPVFFFFRDATAANGDYTCRVVTSALSINTNAAGASLGVPAGQAFRLSVHAFDNAGTVVLALYQSVTFSGAGVPAGVTCWNEGAPASTTGISASATAAATFYTPNGTALTGKAFTPLGYMDFAALATAGDYTAVPTTIQLYRHGVKRPGDTGNRAYGTSTVQVSTSSATVAGNPAVSITLSSSSNLVRAQCTVNIRTTTSSATGGVQIFRNATAIGPRQGCRNDANTTNTWWPVTLCAYDAPQSASSVTYTPYLSFDGGTGSVEMGNSPGTSDATGAMELAEIIV